LSKRSKKELTPEEKEWRRFTQAQNAWKKTTATGLEPDRLEADMRRAAAEASELKRQNRPTVGETVNAIKSHQEKETNHE